MDDNTAETGEETITALTAALAELEGGAGYSILDGQGELVDSGDGWAGLVHRLESALPEGEGDLSVIWP